MSKIKETLKKISHPSKNEALLNGTVIFAISAILSVILAFYDMGVSALVGLFLK